MDFWIWIIVALVALALLILVCAAIHYSNKADDLGRELRDADERFTLYRTESTKSIVELRRSVIHLEGVLERKANQHREEAETLVKRNLELSESVEAKGETIIRLSKEVSGLNDDLGESRVSIERLDRLAASRSKTISDMDERAFKQSQKIRELSASLGEERKSVIGKLTDVAAQVGPGSKSKKALKLAGHAAGKAIKAATQKAPKKKAPTKSIH